MQRAQVSLAVLLDNFVAASSRLEAEESARLVMEKKALRLFKNPLEPLIAKSVPRRARLDPCARTPVGTASAQGSVNAPVSADSEEGTALALDPWT